MNRNLELIIAFVFAFFATGFGIPLGVAPGPEDPFLSAIAPEDCLLYATWSAYKKPNANDGLTDAWMAQDEIQKLFFRGRQASSSYFDNTHGSKRDGAKLDAILSQLPELMLSQPCAFYMTSKSQEFNNKSFGRSNLSQLFNGAAIINVLGREEKIEKQLADLEETTADVSTTKKDGSTWVSTWMGNRIHFTMGIHEHYWVFLFGNETLDNLLERTKSPEPNWLKQLKQKLPVERRSSISWVNVKKMTTTDQLAVSNMKDFLKKSGIKNVSQMGWVTGLNEFGHVSRALIECKPDAITALALFDREPLRRDHLKRIPTDKTISGATRFSAQQTYELLQSFAIATGDAETFDAAMEQANRFTGLSLREDVLSQLGDYVYIYGSVFEKFPNQDWLVSVSVKDEMRFHETFSIFNRRIKKSLEGNGDTSFSQQQLGELDVFGISGWQNRSVFWTIYQQELLIASKFELIQSHASPEIQPNVLAKDDQVGRLFSIGEDIGCEGPVAMMRLDLASMLNKTIFKFAVDAILKDERRIVEQIDFEYADIPDLQFLTNGIPPNLSGVFRTSDGFQLYQEHAFPGGSLGASLAFAYMLELWREHRLW